MSDEPSIHAAIRDALDEFWNRYLDPRLQAIETQVKTTNGRVTSLERKNIRREAHDETLKEVATSVERRLEFKWQTLVAGLAAVGAVAGGVAAAIALFIHH